MDYNPRNITTATGEQIDALSGFLPQTRMAILDIPHTFTPEALERAMNTLADKGWNSVVLPGIYEGYPIFFSQVWADYGMRRQHPDFRKWNPFEVAFEVAAQRGLEVLISFSPYLVIGKKNNPANNPILRRYPKWAAAQHPKRSRRAELEENAPDNNRYFCPVNREVRRFHCDVLHAVLAEYPFNGLVLDLCDYPFYTVGEKEHMAPWCYCAACREDTLRDLGFDPATVNFSNERGMVERWREWQAQQMDEALEYIRTRSLKARSNLRVLGLLPSDSRSAENKRHPLIHWKTWGERSLVEALILEGYPAHAEAFEAQLEKDMETLPENLLLLPVLASRNQGSGDFLQVLEEHPVPGFVMRFDNWPAPDFDPEERIALKTAAFRWNRTRCGRSARSFATCKTSPRPSRNLRLFCRIYLTPFARRHGTEPAAVDDGFGKHQGPAGNGTRGPPELWRTPRQSDPRSGPGASVDLPRVLRSEGVGPPFRLFLPWFPVFPNTGMPLVVVCVG